MPSPSDQLAARVEAFADRVLAFVRRLPHQPWLEEMLKQLIASSSSQAANYRAARRARSRKEFVAKLGLVVEEADESEHWLRRLNTARLVLSEPEAAELMWLVNESIQLRAIFVRSHSTAKGNYERMCEQEREEKNGRRARKKVRPARHATDE